MSLTIREMLLIEEPTVKILKDELMTVAGWFILPSFVFALVLEYFGDFKFLEVVKKLILILVFIGSFYSFHTVGVDLSFKASQEILTKVSPRNIFMRKWTETKVKTADKSNWSMLEKFAIPNVNDLIGTALFLMSKVFIWVLKLVFSTVYHLTYVFAPLTAVLYFFPITRSSIAGTIQSSLWCMFMPIVLVSILAIVGNSIQAPAGNGEISIVSIDHILWLFGVTFLLMMSPVLTLGILRGGGVAMAGSAVGVMMTSGGMKILKGVEAVAKSRGAASRMNMAKRHKDNFQSYKKNGGNQGMVNLGNGSVRDFQTQSKTQDYSREKSAHFEKGKDSKSIETSNNTNKERGSNESNYVRDSKASKITNTERSNDKTNSKEIRSEMKEGQGQVKSKIHTSEKSPEIFREQKRELKSVNSKEVTKDLKRENRLSHKTPIRPAREVRREV